MIQIVDCGSNKVKNIKECVSMYTEEYSVTEFNTIKNTASLEHASGIIISGAPILLTETTENLKESYLKNIEYIIGLNKPILGICFGHQLMGMFFGANIQLCKEDRKFQRIQCKIKNELFEELPFPSVSFKEDHIECIDLPKDFLCLASSNICQVEAMKHKEMPWYGVQFHPEVSGKQGLQLFKNFINIAYNS